MNLKELNSFKLSDAVTFHNELNPKLWINNKLRPDVREQLLVIAQDFLQELGVHDLDVKDITVSGSNAAYSYTKHSDLDLHILVDMGNLPVDEVYKELFNAKKTIYNDSHDIKIHGIPVELYVQDSREPVVSLGEYSVMNDEWIRTPTKRRSDFDQTATKSKYEKLLSLIEIALKSRKYSKVKHIIDTIKRYRQAGLDKGGEFGPENLAFKMLRSQGYITKLYDLRDKLHSEKLSFETMYQNIDEEINSDILDPRFSHTQQIGDYTYTAALEPDVYDPDPKHPVFVIKCYDDGKMIGKAEFYTTFGDSLVSALTTVKPEYQKQGIASTMYAYARMLGNTIEPSASQLPPGKKMWKAWKKSGDAQYLMKNMEEDYTMQFAAEKTPPVSPYAGVKDNQYRGGISEAVTDNYLYHSISSIDTFRKIINTGEIKPKTPIEYEENDIEMPVISASRNQYYRFPYGGGNIQFVIDKDALKHSGYKVKPYSYSQHYGSNQTASTDNVLHKQETEEQIFPFKGHGIPVKQPYIVGIQMNPKFKDTPELEEIQKLSKSVNIPVSFMKTAARPSAKKVDIKLTPKFDPNRFVISPASGPMKEYWPMMMYDKETKTTHGLSANYTNADINDRLKDLNEASGYIPSEKEKNDPRFKTALTVDINPYTMKKGAKQFGWNISRAGIPPTAKTNGKIS